MGREIERQRDLDLPSEMTVQCKCWLGSMGCGRMECSEDVDVFLLGRWNRKNQG